MIIIIIIIVVIIITNNWRGGARGPDDVRVRDDPERPRQPAAPPNARRRVARAGVRACACPRSRAASEDCERTRV